jgi:hypothetical protein
MRTEENFNLFYQRVESFRKEIGGEEPSLPRKRRRPHRYESGDAEPHHHSTAQDHYRIVYFEVIDLVVNGITSRFEQPGYTKYSKLESLLLKAASREDSSEEFEQVTTAYENDIDAAQLSTQLQILGTSFSDSTVTSSEVADKASVTIHYVFEYLRNLSESQQFLMEQVCNVARLLVTLHATNSTSERSFSAMRRLKTYLRSTMSQPRLNHVMIHKELVDELDLYDIENQFVSGSETRLRFFGTFTALD